MLVACFSSGFAGVFFEMLVKTGAQPSVVIRNLQLGIFSLAFATSAVIFNDWSAIAKDGFFQGYHSLVFVIIILQVSLTFFWPSKNFYRQCSVQIRNRVIKLDFLATQA